MRFEWDGSKAGANAKKDRVCILLRMASSRAG
jgi:hypothetical protein